MVALMVFPYVLMISLFQRFIKITQSCFPFYSKRSLTLIVFDPPKTMFNSGPPMGLPNFSAFWMSKMLRYAKIVFVKMDLNYFVCVKSFGNK